MNTNKIMSALQEAENEIQTALQNGDPVDRFVSISWGNNKMGKVASVSLLPVLTCPARCHGTCGDRCYALKLANLRPTVARAYARNTAVARLAPTVFFSVVEKAMEKSEFFRFHVSGDLPNRNYLHMVWYLCNKHPHCTVLMFTKRYELVNEVLADNGEPPKNLKILFSGWTNLKPENPYNLPETTVYARDEDIKPEWTLCGGNCLDCAQHCAGCWVAKSGETIAFKIH